MVDIDELYKLYDEIHNCLICPKMDSEKVLRLILAVNSRSDVFIISQTLAANQLRRSGVNFFQIDGCLGNTGASLEKFLNRFHRTVYPHREVAISKNVTIPRCRATYISVYNTEIAQCYPGKGGGKGDRPPESDEISRCINRGFLLREIKLIKPKLLMLMGRASRDSFSDYVLKAEYPQSLSEHISNIVKAGEIPIFSLDNLVLHVLPIQHASGANPRFHSMMNDSRLIELIKEVLR